MKTMRITLMLVLALVLCIAVSSYAITDRLGAAHYSYNPTKILSKTSAYTVTTSDVGALIKVSASGGAVTITLPSTADVFAAGQIQGLAIKKTDSSVNAVTLSPASGNTIGGESARVIVNQNGWIAVRPNGKDWIVDFESPYVVEDHEAGSSDLGTQGYDASIVFEGATANAFETTLAVTDPTADATWQIPAATAGTYYFMSTALATNYVDAANAVTGVSNGFQFEGATADAFEITLSPADATADTTATIPNATGTLAMTSGVGSYMPYTAPTVSTTFTTADCGKVIGIATDALTHVLPAGAAGCWFRFVNVAAAAGAVVQVKTDGTGAFKGTVISGSGALSIISASTGSVLTNVKATSNPGDNVMLYSTGSNTWIVTSNTGTWSSI